MCETIKEKILERSNGRFVSVCFVKKDGTERVINGRLGVTKHLAGGVSTLDPTKYITLYDNRARGYRAVNRSTILWVKFEGKLYV